MSLTGVRRGGDGSVNSGPRSSSRFWSLVAELPVFKPTVITDFAVLTTNLGFPTSNRVENKICKAPPAMGTVIASPCRLPDSNTTRVAVLYS